MSTMRTNISQPLASVSRSSRYTQLQSIPGNSGPANAAIQMVGTNVHSDLRRLSISAHERIKQAHTGMLKITTTTRNNGQIMDDGNRGNQSIL